MDPERIGYIKPVGQELVRLPDDRKVDKDAMIVDRFSGIPDIDMNYVSPVQLASGFTKEYLASDHPELISDRLRNDILEAVSAIEHKSVVIAEGTGHPGVGGIVGLSNAHVANLTGAQMLYLSGGGIGKAIDMLEVDLTFFMYHNVKMRGILFNKVFKSKIDQIKKTHHEDVLNRKYCFRQAASDLRFPAGAGRSGPAVDERDSRVVQGKLRDRRCRGRRLEKNLKNDPRHQPPGRVPHAREVPRTGGPGRDRLRFGEAHLAHLGVQRIAAGTAPRHRTHLRRRDASGRSAVREIERSGIRGWWCSRHATTERGFSTTYENTSYRSHADKYREIRTMFAEHFEFEKFLETSASAWSDRPP